MIFSPDSPGFGGLHRASLDRQFADDGDKKELVAEESAE
jgi:hypothetical protein